MLIEQFREAAAGARNNVALDSVARLAWRALSEGHLSEVDAQAVSEAVEARRAWFRGRSAQSALKPASARRRPVSPDKAKSLARRRQLAASGAVPSHLAAAFTQGEVAALSVVAREVRRRGRCELSIDAIAAMAGVSRTTVQGALRHARRLGLIAVTERRRRGQRSETNMVEILAPEWRAWLRLGSGFGKRNTTENKILGLVPGTRTDAPTSTGSCRFLMRSGPGSDIFQSGPDTQSRNRAGTRSAIP